MQNPWLKLLRTVLSLAEGIARYIANKQLMDAGEAKSILRQVRKSNEKTKKAINIRKNTRLDADDDGVLDSDEFGKQSR